MATVLDLSGNTIKADGFDGPVSNSDVTAIAALTDNTGGTADSTIANVPQAVAADTDTTAASLASVNSALTAIEADICDLTGKINALLSALKGS